MSLILPFNVGTLALASNEWKHFPNGTEHWLNVEEIINLDVVISGFSDCYVSIFIPDLDNYTLTTPTTIPLFLFGLGRTNPSANQVCTQSKYEFSIYEVCYLGV
jgi:hypothetical protein